MLRQRVITALVLVGLLLGALVLGTRLGIGWPFAVLTLALMAAAGWEWGRLNQAGSIAALVMGAAIAVGGVLAYLAGWSERAPPLVWWLTLVLWLVAGSLALRSGPPAWPRLPRVARCAVGLLALWAAWLALTQARAIGVNFMLSLLCLVWMADVAAYFGGRAFGQRKLAPSISPGKSWEGVWSGMVGVLLLAAFWVWLDRALGLEPSLYSRLLATLDVVGTTLALLALCGFSVMGDLIESLVKRAAGAKDSSQLLPGHGGVLDRVDALLPVLPAALAMLTLASLVRPS